MFSFQGKNLKQSEKNNLESTKNSTPALHEDRSCRGPHRAPARRWAALRKGSMGCGLGCGFGCGALGVGHLWFYETNPVVIEDRVYDAYRVGGFNPFEKY